MGCGSSRVSGELEQVQNATVTGAGVAAFTVHGAGIAAVNGVYVRDGRFDGVPCFKNGKIWLCRHQGNWFIGESETIEKNEGDYYQLLEDHLLPPTFGWEVAEDGKEPVPRIEAVLEGPATLVVEGAGLTQANGRFTRNGTHGGAPKYTNGSLSIYRDRGNWFRWMIGESETMHENRGDLYRSETSSDYPPLSASNWQVDEDGKEPAPTITALDDLGRPIYPGWVPRETAPAFVAVATYVAEPVVEANVIVPGEVVGASSS